MKPIYQLTVKGRQLADAMVELADLQAYKQYADLPDDERDKINKRIKSLQSKVRRLEKND